MVRQGFIAGGLLLALLLGLLWPVSALAQQQFYNNTGVNGLVATITANAASSIQFTGANWSTNYNSLYLNCTALTASTSGVTLEMEVGESAAGWETGAHYTSDSAFVQTTTASDILDATAKIGYGDKAMSLTTTSAAFLQFTINNPGSSTLAKIISGVFGGGVSQDAYGQFAYVSGWWNSDTNALTGIELVPSTGTLSGICSLYGIP
jgi:hypothetical protein